MKTKCMSSNHMAIHLHDKDHSKSLKVSNYCTSLG